MKYLLDTNTCIQFLNRRSGFVLDRLSATDDQLVAVCSIVKAEMFFGAERSSRKESTRAVMHAFFSRYVSLDFDDAAAAAYAPIRATLESAGQPIGANDLLIASIAVAHDMTLVTHNTAEFRRVAQLRLEDWEV